MNRICFVAMMASRFLSRRFLFTDAQIDQLSEKSERDSLETAAWIHMA
jgi:hypothetical protein